MRRQLFLRYVGQAFFTDDRFWVDGVSRLEKVKILALSNSVTLQNTWKQCFINYTYITTQDNGAE